MAAYLVKVSYKEESIEDTLHEGTSGRKKNVEELVNSLGGNVESFSYSFGKYAVYCVSGIPDHTTAAALALTLNKSGLVTCTNLVPISPEDINDIKK